MSSVREMATISARWLNRTIVLVSCIERSANSDSFSTIFSVPPKLNSWSPALIGRNQSHELPDTNTWMPRNDGRRSLTSGGSPNSGRFIAIGIIGAPICEPHRVVSPYPADVYSGLSSPYPRAKLRMLS